MPLDYLDHLRSDSDRFIDVLRRAPGDAPVPSCPDWDADDLLWHLGGVQWFWGRSWPSGSRPPTASRSRSGPDEEDIN